MAYLLDTNILSELRNPAKTDPNVLAWSISTASDDHFVSAISLGEIRKGIEILRRKAPDQCPAFEKWLGLIQKNHRDRILPITEEIMEIWGRLMVRKTLPAIDSLLAATALNLGLTLVTRNETDFEIDNLAVLNPFDHPTN